MRLSWPRSSVPALTAGALTLTFITALGSGGASAAGPSLTERVSLSTSGVQGDRPSGRLGGYEVSADGRYVAFGSRASNLVPHDTNRIEDVFVRDRVTQTTERVSVGNRQQTNAFSLVTDISPNGRYVAFTSYASNLVPRDTNGRADVFVRDRRSRRTIRVSVNSKGAQGDSYSQEGVISADGRFVAFESAASNLVRHDTNDAVDVFVRDLRRGMTTRVSVSTRGAQARFPRRDVRTGTPAMSADGRFVAFTSEASNLVRGDTNDRTDVFVRDRVARNTRRVSVRTSGRQFANGSVNPDISPDGRFVVFQTGFFGRALITFRIHLRDRRTGTTRLASLHQELLFNNYLPSVSANGRYVVFTSNAPLPGEDPLDGSYDAILTDLRLRTTTPIALSFSGAKVSASITTMSADGRWVVFGSESNAVVPGDTNHVGDVFIHRR